MQSRFEIAPVRVLGRFDAITVEMSDQTQTFAINSVHRKGYRTSTSRISVDVNTRAHRMVPSILTFVPPFILEFTTLPAFSSSPLDARRHDRGGVATPGAAESRFGDHHLPRRRRSTSVLAKPPPSSFPFPGREGGKGGWREM